MIHRKEGRVLTYKKNTSIKKGAEFIYNEDHIAYQSLGSTAIR